LPEVSQSFEIGQPVERVWAFFQDVPQVVTCMPGLELTGQTGANAYQGKVRMRLGPVTAAFEGEATILDVNDSAHHARIEAKGIDRKGGSRASAAVVYDLAAIPGGTRVTLAGDIKLTGALAQIGRTGIIQDVAAQLTSQFAEALRAKLAATASASPDSSFSPALAGGDQGDRAGPGPGSLPHPLPQGEEGRTQSTAPMSATRFLLAVLWRRIKRLFGTQ
jgi:carbon monoxide dehydrogenase subunit G